MAEQVVESGERPVPLHQFWWLHDARWYQGVAKRFGQEVANEINAEALKFVARRIAAWCAHQCGGADADAPVAELFPLLRRIAATMWSPDMVSVEHRCLGADEWETVVTNHFVPRMLRAAGSTDGYACACLPTRAGFHEGIGVPVQDRKVECRFDGGQACRFRTVATRRPSPALAGSGAEPRKGA